jgi:AraC-like DNA-binding protein
LYAEILHCEHINFGRTLGITIRREFLGREVQANNQGHDRTALLKQLFPEITDVKLASRLYDEISAALPQREVRLRKIAGMLAMSPRTLQRRLSVIPDGLRGAVGRVRMHLAMEYLQDESMTLIAVSLLLGYSDQCAFHLAFRRQFGTSPGRWRLNISIVRFVEAIRGDSVAAFGTEPPFLAGS